ncbi:aflatoxin B1 aldehyde reductase member 3-like [Oscarella lobularis]|uniref:aflatoxin B1 aldehyde reductase member 3-like n=1 Tax=Oscarella lobularis TaxID=121494 RepID=UPI0033139ED9
MTTRLIFGSSEVGRQMGIGDTTIALENFLHRGHTEIDSARVYGEYPGQTEEILGQIPLEIKAKCKIATKASPRWSKEGLTPDAIRKQLDASLKDLGMSSIDMLYLHWADPDTPLEKTLQGCHELYAEGKFKELAVSNYSSWEVAKMCEICKTHGFVMPTVYQGMYNVITRDVEKELFPCLRHYGIRFYAYNPTAGGFLTGRYKFEDAENPKSQQPSRFFAIGGKWAEINRKRYWWKENFVGYDLVHETLKTVYGTKEDGTPAVSVLQAAFRWLKHHSKLSKEHGDGIILGCSKLTHMEDNLASLEGGPLDERVVAAQNEAWNMAKRTCPSYVRQM